MSDSILKDMTPIGVPIAGSDFSMSGYDMDFACVRGACALLWVCVVLTRALARAALRAGASCLGVC